MFVAEVSGSVDVGIGNYQFWGSMMFYGRIEKYHSWKAKTKMYWKHGHFQNQSPISEMLNWSILLPSKKLLPDPLSNPLKSRFLRIISFADCLVGRFSKRTTNQKPTTMPRHRSCMMHLTQSCAGQHWNTVASKQLVYKWYILPTGWLLVCYRVPLFTWFLSKPETSFE